MKPKRTHRKVSKGKGKVLRKGQSSSSNPECTKHRSAAKKRAFFGNPGNSNLTVAQLQQHDKITTNDILDDEDDVMSIGAGTALTGFTNCTLPTFSRLFKNWNSNSFLHKEMLALLEATAEVIKGEGEEESEAKYFSALVVLLDDITSDETLTAIICLLSMVVRKMNDSSLLKLQELNVHETFTKLLIKYMNSDHCALLRNLLSIMYGFLKTRTVWPEKCEEIRVILEFTTHHKPKVRKVSHSIIRKLLDNCVPESATIHPLAPTIADFCIKKLETSSPNSKETFYILAVLNGILGLFSRPDIKKACETIIKVMTLSNAMVTSSCLKALQGLFKSSEYISDLNPRKSKMSVNISAELNAKIISAMYPYQPNVKETQCLIEWLFLMKSAFINLYKLDAKLCIGHFPNFFATAVKCWLSDREDTMQAVAVTLYDLLLKCIDPSHEVFQSFLFDDPMNNPMYKMFGHVEQALSYQYHKAWKYVIVVLAGFFETMGKHCHTAMMKCLQSLADLHDSFKFPHVSDVEKALGVAIEHMGPRIVLTAVPLQISDEKPDFPRSWLLPLLRDHIKRTELNFFAKYFLSLAKKVKNRALTLKQEDRIVESKLFEVIYTQIWSLLPGFCTEPTDFDQSFTTDATTGKGLPRILADVLKSEPPLRLTILSALRLLITKNADNESQIETMVKYSGNYLPVLFNLYSPDSKDQIEDNVRLATYETIKIYLQITKKETCFTFFTKALEKLSTVQDDIFKQTSLIDITKALLPYIDESLIEKLYEFCKPLLKHSNHTMQKKAFGVIKEICSCNSDSCLNFMKSNRDDLRLVLSEPITTLPPATKALRLICLQCMVSQFTIDELDCIKEIIPEAVLSTKVKSRKARIAAYSLLVAIGHYFKRIKPEDTKDALKQYVALLLAGLRGDPHMMSTTILSIGNVIYEFMDDLELNLINLLIENLCELLKISSREVLDSVLSVLKIIISKVDTMILAQHVEILVKGLTNIADDQQRHFRFTAKELLTRFVRKFGYEMIFKLASEKAQKQLRNIKKLETRRQRNKALKNTGADSDDEIFDKNTKDFDAILEDSDDEIEDFNLLPKVKEPKRKKNKETYLEERDEDDIVDFMDPSASKRLTSMPTKEDTSTKKTKTSFPIADDGRLIIEDEDSKTKKKLEEKEKEAPSFEKLVKNSKRKFEDSEDEHNVSKPKTEGVKKGIHRTLEPKAKKKRFGEEFKAKKAGGDIKKGKLEPYAYVPFNRQALNKRKKIKLKGQYKNIVKAAKKGAVIGLKRKARESKKKKSF